MRKKKKISFFGFKDKFARRRTLFVLGIIILIILIKIILGFIFSDKEPTEITFKNKK